ncbi:hypothetical protein FB45DRAFT_889749 [Roridomyces roridus]|uniref:Uncharacterized protein n=1 Tax=Roridomyces roridus TaxID=1738132 RepID=A0AAD7CKQ1_9AGAR|nr:hypothetical protein FB45DRAFT_889749 [Roridomyces roridus]
MNRAYVSNEIDKSTLVHLGRRSTLEKLHTKLPAGMSFAKGKKMFPALVECLLEIERGDILSFISFVQTWNQPPLETLCLTFLDQVPKDHIEECYRTLATHIDTGCLDEFKLDIFSQAPGIASRAHAFIYPSTYLRLLFTSFPNLRIVLLRVPIGYDLDDGVVLDLARALGAQLEEFSLVTDDQRVKPKNTLGGLRALAKYCPYLEKLVITFDASSVPEEEAQAPTRQFGIAELDVGFSEIAAHSSAAVARFLSSHFPCLEHIKALVQTRRWKQVQDRLPIRQVRRSARKGA